MTLPCGGYFQHRQPGMPTGRNVESGKPARVPGKQCPPNARRPSAVVIDPCTAHQLQARRASSDDLKVVLVSRSVQCRWSPGEGPPKGSDQPLVGSGAYVLAGDPILPSCRIQGSDNGQRKPEPRHDLPEREDVVLPIQVPAMDPAAGQRVVGRDQHHAATGALNTRPDGVDDLRLTVGGTGGGGVDRPRPGLQPPLRVEQEQANSAAHIDDTWPRTAASRFEDGKALSSGIEKALLPQRRIPAVLPMSSPVMIAEHEVRSGAGTAHDLELSQQAALGISPSRILWSGHASGIDVVAQEDDDPLPRARSEVLVQGLKHRLTSRVRRARIPDQVYTGDYLRRR
jgi:hypothetical protein